MKIRVAWVVKSCQLQDSYKVTWRNNQKTWIFHSIAVRTLHFAYNNIALLAFFLLLKGNLTVQYDGVLCLPS